MLGVQQNFDLPAVIAIGASAGGVEAVRRILFQLVPAFQTPIVIVQHIPATARLDLGLVYGSGTHLKVFEVQDKMQIDPGCAYMAAPDYHLLMERDGTFSLTQDELVNWSRPSIDVFFESVAFSFGPRALGILLTGANQDGAKGLLQMRDCGAQTIVQNPLEASSDVMPKSALALMKPDHILTLDEIAKHLNAWTRR